MSPRSRSAVAKRDAARPPEVKTLATAKGAAYPAGRMLIASPQTIDAVVAQVPAGRVVTFGALRAALAAQFGADYTCPITTGIFLRVAAEAAEEERLDGAPATAPWWRVVRDDGGLLDKLPGGPARQAAQLTAEGVSVAVVRGVPKRVAAVDTVAWVP